MRWQAERLRRGLSGDTGLAAFRVGHELDEIERDVDRALRRADLDRRLAHRSGAGGLSAPAELLPPYPADIRGADRLLGTGKLFVRVGRLLDEADGLTASGSGSARLLPLLDEAIRLLAGSDAPAADPNLVALSARIRNLRAGVPSG